MQKVITAEQAAALVPDGAAITISGTIGFMLPAPILDALELRYLTTGEPKGLTWFDIFPTGLPGIEPLAHPGMVKRVISGWFTLHPRMKQMILANEVEAYCYPLGTLAFWCREMAAGRDGFLTTTGLGTSVDPRQGGGRLNDASTDDLVSLVEIDGKEQIWFRSFPVDVAILRGTTVDADGNLSLEQEQATMSVLYQALAAKRSGGTVIVQAKKLVERGAIHPRSVVVPGELVDAIVIAPDAHSDEALPDMDWLDPFARGVRLPRTLLRSGKRSLWRQWLTEGAPAPDEERVLTADVIASRRAVLEMHRGGVYNFGLGMPARDVIPATIDEEIDQDVTLSIETGVLGGQVNGSGFRSGVTSILDTPGIFSMYATKVMDGTFLSMLEFDRQGNVNLLRYGDTIVGPGGSMDIAEHNPKITFLGTLRAGGLSVECVDGKLRVVEEGSHPRGVEQVQAISFNGRRMFEAGKEVLYVTERAVFRLTEDGPMLIEVAPGIDVEKDVLACMGFRPAIAETVREMDARIFRPGPLGLRQDWETGVE